MSDQESLIEVPSDDWDQLLRRVGVADAYLQLSYVRSSCELTPAEPVLLHQSDPGGDVVFACLVRDDPTDVITPYGYGGPVASGPSPPVERFASGYEQWCRTRGVVSSFVVYHPLFQNHHLSMPSFHNQPLGGTIAWRLTDVDLLQGMHRHHRRMIRRAQAAELIVRVTEGPSRLGEFVDLYRRSMVRVDADPFYLFGDAYWAALARGVPLVQVDVLQQEEPIASVLGLASPPWMHYHLGGSAEVGRELGATHLALYALASWAQERGYEALHLGGGVGGTRDSLYLFKERFAPSGGVEALVGMAVHDTARYRELTGRDEIRWDGFFPAYRAPH